MILQNHGLLTVEESSVDEAAFWFINLDKTCHAQLLADAASAGTGHKKIMIDEEEAEVTAKQVGAQIRGGRRSRVIMMSSLRGRMDRS